MDATAQIDQYMVSLPAWQAECITLLRQLIHQAVPDVEETWKWNTPVYLHNGLLCATGVFKNHVKLNLFQGAGLADQSQFNAGLESKKSRGIDFKAGDVIDQSALLELIVAAAAFND